MNKKNSQPPSKSKPIVNGSPQGSVASRIKNLQQNLGNASGSDDSSDQGDLYAQVIKPKVNRGTVSKPCSNQDTRAPTKQWPPPKPNLPPKSDVSATDHVVNPSNSPGSVSRSTPNLPSKIHKIFGTDTTAHATVCNREDETPKVSGSSKNRADIKIKTPPPKPPSKFNRSNLIKTISSESEHADDQKGNDVTRRAPWHTTNTKTSPVVSKFNKTNVANNGSTASESSEEEKSGVKSNPFLSKTGTQSPMLPSKFNRPKLPIKTSTANSYEEIGVTSNPNSPGVTTSPGLTTSPGGAHKSPPKVPAKVLKLSYSSSSASESSEEGRGESLQRSTSKESTPGKVIVKQCVSKMKTPPPMIPPNRNQLKLVKADDVKHDQGFVSKTSAVDRDSPSPVKPKPPVLPSKVNRPCLQKQQSLADIGDWDEDMESARSSVDRLGLDGVQSPPHTPLGRSKALFRSVDNLDATDPAVQDETNSVTLRKSRAGSSLRSGIDSSEPDEKEKEPKKRISISLQGVKPLSMLKKYLGSSNDQDKSVTKSETEKGGEANKRWSVGDGFKANLASISNMFKQKKSGDGDHSPKTKRLSEDTLSTHDPADAPPADLNQLKSSPTLKNALVLTKSVPVMNSQPQMDDREVTCSSQYENIEFLAPRDESDYDDNLDDDNLDEDDEWDDDEFTDGEEDQVETLKCRALSYENYDRESHIQLIERRKQVVEEMVSTETSYVNKLYLLNKTAWEVGGANLVLDMFHPSKVHHMFPSIEALYRLHGENILPAMKITLENWSGTPELFPMWKKYLPFLTMYKSYTSQFDGALDTINQYKKSTPEFATLLTKLEEKSEFGKLCLEHHLIEPIQRIARYKLLLQNYSKLLMEGEDENTRMSGVVQSIDQLLNDCQKQLRQQDTFGDLCKLQERFEDTLSLMSPTAHLIKEGPMVQISGNNYKKKIQRHIFLFSDCILICTKRPSGKFRIIYQMELAELKIRPVDAACAALYGTERTMILREGDSSVTNLFKAEDIKAEWEEAILDAITVKLMQGQLRRCGNTDAHTHNRDECNSHCQDESREARNHGDVNFNRVPEWKDDDVVTSCMSCDSKFISVLRKKYHCRGCGWVICGSCCRQKMALPCMNGEICRVCNLCFIRARRSYAHLTRRISTVDLQKLKSRRTVKSRDSTNLETSSNYNLEIIHGLPWLEDVECGSSET